LRFSFIKNLSSTKVNITLADVFIEKDLRGFVLPGGLDYVFDNEIRHRFER